MRRQNGFVFLELLVVLVVIAILAGSYFNRSNSPKGEEGTYQRSMTRSNDAACLANRVSLRTSIQMFQLNNPGQPVTTENMQKVGMNPATCPEGGSYGFTKEGTILCSKHDAKQ
jgi:prepilin-type N-terminal cleavage/methylation domain-containing protein